MRQLVVLRQDIVAKIFGRIPPDRVDVVTIILSVIELEHEVATLQTIVMLVATLNTAHPSEAEFVYIDRLAVGLRNFRAVTFDDFIDQAISEDFLRLVHVRDLESGRLK